MNQKTQGPVDANHRARKGNYFTPHTTRISFSPNEVSNYYRYRVPTLKQVPNRWRGPCPIHGGRGSNFSVDPNTGQWHCFSQCGRGGDIIALEMALAGSGFLEARASVFSTIGRPDPVTDEPARREFADHWRDAEKALLWQRGVLHEIDGALASVKDRFFACTEGIIADGELIGVLTRREATLFQLSGTELIDAYRDAMVVDPISARRAVRYAVEDREHATRLAVIVIRMLECATLRDAGAIT